MSNVVYDKYSNKYYIKDKLVLTFEQLEVFKEELQAICTDVYSEQLATLDLGADDCESGACKI